MPMKTTMWRNHGPMVDAKEAPEAAVEVEVAAALVLMSCW